MWAWNQLLTIVSLIFIAIKWFPLSLLYGDIVICLNDNWIMVTILYVKNMLAGVETSWFVAVSIS